MRHLLANVFTYLLAGLLLLGSAVFALVRSEQIVISDEATALARFEDREPTVVWREFGARSYAGNCQPCHRARGEGWDQYPPLTDLDAMLVAPGGRDYLIALHLFGVASDRWRAPMPPMGHMQDVELAAVINHVLGSFGNVWPPGVPLITPAEIAAHRQLRLRAVEVGRLRP